MNGYDPADPYSKREDRFAVTILYDNASFKDSYVETFAGGKDGLFATPTATKTGYYMRKFLVPSINLEKGETARRSWIFFRYAEVILNYAEARNEVYGPDATVYKLLNEIRARVGLRNNLAAGQLTGADGLSPKEEIRKYIKHERRVELAFEEHRFWDLRRWKDAETVLNKPIKGMQIEKNGSVTYTVFDVGGRTFDPKFYWYPIPRAEILKYKSKGIALKQNHGWE